MHGVGGTTAQSLLFDADAVRVAGDDLAGFYRTADHNGRHIEAYSWGSLTSHPWTRALWLLLFPFAVANVAGWAQRRGQADSQTIDPRRTAAGVVVTLLALSLTVMVVVGVSYVAFDTIALQCGAVASCAEPRAWTRVFSLQWAAERPGARLALASLIPLGVVFGLWYLARRTRNTYESRLPPGQVLDDEDVPRLARQSTWMRARGTRRDAWLHFGAALTAIGTVLALAVGHVTTEADAAKAVTVAGMVVFGLLVVLVVLTAEHLRVDGIAVGGGAVVLVAALFLAVTVQPKETVLVPLHWPARANQYVFVTQILLLLALAVCLALQNEDGDADESGAGVPAFRWLAPVVFVGLGVLAAGSALAGVTVRVADVLGKPVALEPAKAHVTAVSTSTTISRPPTFRRASPTTSPLAPAPAEVQLSTPPTPIAYPASSDWTGAAMAGTAFLLLLTLATVGWRKVWRVRQSEKVALLAEYTLTDPPPDSDYGKRVARRRSAWAASVVRARHLTAAVKAADRLVSTLVLAVLVVAAGAVVFVARLGARPFPPLPWSPVATASSWVAAALPVFAVGFMRAARSDAVKRKELGILWDLGTFWPRWFHPWAPPSYSERAVPDLQARLFALTEDGRVLLSAHSQGAVLAATAVRGLPPDRRARIALVTYGAPLSFLYPVVFPNSFLPSPAADAGLHSWHNFWRQTDPIGGSVAETVGELPTIVQAEPPEGPDESNGDDGGDQSQPVVFDIELPDPARPDGPPGGPFPPVAGHSHYLEDEGFKAKNDEIAASLAETLSG